MRFSQTDGRGHTRRIRSDETPIEAIVQALESVSGRAPDDLAPLHSAVETDALERLFHSAKDEPVAPFRISFTYDDYEVSVNRSAVRLTELSDRRNS